MYRFLSKKNRSLKHLCFCVSLDEYYHEDVNKEFWYLDFIRYHVHKSSINFKSIVIVFPLQKVCRILDC